MRPEQSRESTQEAHAKPVILVLAEFYLPGFKSGGGMRPLVNMVERFGDDYEFFIVTRDHDGKADKTPYSNITYGVWHPVGKAAVRYLAKDQIRVGEIKKIAREVRPDLVFCNSYFSTLTIFAMLLRRMGTLKRVPVAIAPQGELTDWALNRKQGKKSAFIAFASRLGLYRDVIWRASSETEAAEIEKVKGSGGRIIIAPDMMPKAIFPEYEPERKPIKEAGAAEFVYLSRIHPGKNLEYLLELFRDVEGTVLLDVIGPEEADEEYLRKCKARISELPANVRVRMLGEIEHSQVLETLVDYHFFVLPTLSENFGYVFLEAMSAGCPIVISDRTVWRSLEEKGVGWDIPVEDRALWLEVLEECVRMDGEAYAIMSSNARRFASEWLADNSIETANRSLFEEALAVPA